jgi:nucleotide-binding universal stress UspA family protein
MLDWVIPLAQATNASMTLLVVATPILPFYTREIRRFQGLVMLLTPDSPIYAHIQHCAERLSQAGIAGYLKLRHGSPRQQIADELADGNYDLVAIAAEAHGDFVEEVFTEVETRALHTGRAFMIAKPALP